MRGGCGGGMQGGCGAGAVVLLDLPAIGNEGQWLRRCFAD
jgi:hypothetical protein